MTNKCRFCSGASSHCTLEKNRIIVRKEKQSCFKVYNHSNTRVLVCRVDGGLINDRRKRCDYQVQIGETDLVLVELKGIHIDEAVEQIICTAEALNYQSDARKKRSIIVSSPTPNSSTRLQNAILKFRKRYLKQGISFPRQKNLMYEEVV